MNNDIEATSIESKKMSLLQLRELINNQPINSQTEYIIDLSDYNSSGEDSKDE